MTLTEVCTAIEAETHTRTWAEATPALRLLVIKGCIEAFLESCYPDATDAAKKVVKQRKVRKPKPAPLTQHAEGVGEYAAKLVSGHGD